MRQIRMVIGTGAELDHGEMLPQEFLPGQTQIGDGYKIKIFFSCLIIHHFFNAFRQTLMWR
jgi:hypothetical protein